MSSILFAHVSGVIKSRVDFEKSFTVAIGDGSLKAAVPKLLNTPWEDLIVLPALEAAINGDAEGALLKDVVAQLATDNIGFILKSTGFVVDDEKRTVHFFVHGARRVATHQHVPIDENTCCNASSRKSLPASTSSDVSRSLQRQGLPQNLKLLTKKLVCDICPRDSEGVFLSSEAKDPALRKPAWVMDELFKKLSSEISVKDADSCLKFAYAYLRRERQKQINVTANKATEMECNNFKSGVSNWLEGPYGKSWEFGVRERPRQGLLCHASATTNNENNV